MAYFLDVMFPNVTVQDVQSLFKQVYKKKREGQNLFKIAEYSKLLKLCTVRDKHINKAACFGVVALCYTKPSDIEEILQVLLTLLHDAEDSTGLVTCIINLSISYWRMVRHTQPCAMKKKHPLNTVLTFKSDILGTMLYLINDFLGEDDMFEMMVPLFKKTLCLPGDDNITNCSTDLWRMVLKTTNLNIFFVILLWSKISDSLLFKAVLFESKCVLSQNIGLWCLFLVLLTAKLSAEGYTCKEVLHYLSEIFPIASKDVQLIAMIVICQTIYKSLIFNMDDLLQLAESFIGNINFGSEVIWIFIVTLAKYMKSFPTSKEKTLKMMNTIFDLSKRQEKMYFQWDLDVIEETVCVRFSELNEAASIAGLLAKLHGNEETVLSWLSVFPKRKTVNTGEEMLLFSLLIGGTDAIKKKCLNILPKFEMNATFLLFLVTKEEDSDILLGLFKALCKAPKNENEELALCRILQKLQKNKLKPSVLMKFYLWIWQSDNKWNLDLEFMLGQKYLLIKDITVQANIIKKIVLIDSSCHAKQFIPSLFYIIEKTHKAPRGPFACSIAFDTLCLLSDIKIIDFWVIFDVAVKKLINHDHIWVRNSCCKLLGRVPRETKTDRILLSVQILWSFVTDKKLKCLAAYKALRNYTLADFTKECLPSTCSTHLISSKEESEKIPARCWIHLLKLASSTKQVGNLLKFLLKKDLQTTRGKTNIPEDSQTLFEGLWNYINKFHDKKKRNVNVLELCLVIVRGQFSKGLPAKSFYCLDYLMKENDNKLRMHALTMLIRQALYHKPARSNLENFIQYYSSTKLEVQDYVAMCKLLLSLKSICRDYVLKEVLDGIEIHIQSCDKQKLMKSLYRLQVLEFDEELQSYTRKVIKNVWKSVSYEHEYFPELLDEFSKFTKETLDDVIEDSTTEELNKAIDLFSNFALHSKKVLSLIALVNIGVKHASFRYYIMRNIQQTIFCLFCKNIGTDGNVCYDWLSYLLSRESNTLSNNFFFEIFILSMDIYANNIPYGTINNALERFPQSCAKVFLGYRRVVEFLEFLRFWQQKGRLHSKYARACTLALMVMHDDSEVFHKPIWNNILL